MESSSLVPFHHLPAVGKILTDRRMEALARQYGREIVAAATRREIERLRSGHVHEAGDGEASIDAVCERIALLVRKLCAPGLKRVINASGIVLHTNLGRAPLGAEAAGELARVAQGYCNLELDLSTGRRGNRQTRLAELLRCVTGAEGAIAVNNNAAALLLLLRECARRREVIVSRGELIEIGDAFRLPDIMRESGAKLVEVGTTNRTRLADYEEAITPKTAMLLKVHTSNFRVSGFTEDVASGALARLARARGLLAAFDLGSGMLRRPAGLPLDDEPTVQDAISAGADLVCFSGDKLMGGAQAGIIVGRADLIARLARAPLMRALRPGRLVIAALEAAALFFLDDRRLLSEHPVFRMIAERPEVLRLRSERLVDLLRGRGVDGCLEGSDGQVGGGALPGLALPGCAVTILLPARSQREAKRCSEKLVTALLSGDPPVLAVLREGRCLLDVRTIGEEELALAADAVSRALSSILPPAAAGS